MNYQQKNQAYFGSNGCQTSLKSFSRFSNCSNTIFWPYHWLFSQRTLQVFTSHVSYWCICFQLTLGAFLRSLVSVIYARLIACMGWFLMKQRIPSD